MSYAAPNFAHIVHKQLPAHVVDFELEPLAPSHRGFEPLRPFLLGMEAANQELLSERKRADRKTAYIAALLATTDAQWRYQMASGADWRDGHRHFQALREEQAAVDPSGEVWLSIAPKGHDIPQPRLPGISCSQCGLGFGLGKYGFSRCADHAHLKAVAS